MATDDREPAHQTRHTTIPRGESVVGFAPYRGPWICRSREGKWRPRHQPDSDSICVICDRKITPGKEGG